MIRTSDFDYHLPPDYIAQDPIEPRDASRLLVLHRSTGKIEHTLFRKIGETLHPEDLLVLNQTKVIPARLYGKKVESGGKVELLLVKKINELTWEALVGGKGITSGKTIKITNGPNALVIKKLSGPRRWVQFEEPIEVHLDLVGNVPLPPYIHTPLHRPERYQTIYASEPGSVAAPTAGLHFTSMLMKQLKVQGIQFTNVTLHIGLDTFSPVKEDNPFDHEIHSEWCTLTQQAANKINSTYKKGRKVIAVGTTSVRVLETVVRNDATQTRMQPFSGFTDLFILPGFDFKIVGGLITNFHLPKSTLIMLVSAFVGKDLLMHTYEVAKKEKYRFYSFGDAMLIL